jgi:septum formation topological specificity factor MinE
MKKKTAVSPGMNRFQWTMCYPAAAHINGVYNSFFAAARPIGPEVVPGTYYVKLSYGNTTLKRPFVVKLDPRLNLTQAQLQQRFDLLMNIHKALDRLDNTLNRAIDARDRLQKALAHKRLSGDRATEPLDRLNHDIARLVDLKIQSGEGALVYSPRLRAWLTFIASDVSLSFAPPTQSQTQVAKMYIEQAHAGASRLQSDIASAKAVLNR